MASKVIKGLTVEIAGDTTKLGKALDGVETKSRNLSKELGEVNRLLKMDPGNTELLAQKQQILAEAVENTKEKLNTLKEAEAQVQAQFERGEVSAEQVRALKREIEATEQKLRSYERAVDETADEVNRLGTGADDAAHEIDDMADAADDAKDSSNELGSSLDGTLANGFTVVAAAAAAAAAAIVGCVEASHEYRTAMGKLETAFTTNGLSAETAYNTYADLQSILGETDQAVEAANHLAALVDNEEDLVTWTEIATGVYAKFGDSLPIEGLTEAANETAKVGKVTGPLADALNWAAQNGRDFGVVLKENTGFTELSAKELKKLTKKQREEYEARKKQQEEIDEYNERVLEAVSAEDKFNIALENCTTEQERQQLITETLSEAYKDAAAVYKDTNKEVIAANEANEDWNKTVAEIGETMSPVVTDFKKFGTELLKQVREPLKDVATFIRNTVLPALTGIVDWFRSNIPTIKAALVGVTAAIVAFKVATIATEIAQKGLKGAILATAAAQEVLNIVQNASPIGLLVTVVVGLTAALIALSLATEEAGPKTAALTEEEQALLESAEKTAQAFRDQKEATDKALGDITAEMTHTQNLAKELQNLADASGRVKEKDQERANFIINELNEALDTEYEMVGGVIQQYGDLKKNIDEVIQSKLANSLLEAANADYVAAIQAEGEAWDALSVAEKNYLEQKKIHDDEVLRINRELVQAEEDLRVALDEGLQYEAKIAGSRVWNLKGELLEVDKILAEKETAYNDAAANYKQHSDAIISYEDAQTAALEGNYSKAVDILAKKGGEYSKYTGIVDEETAKQLEALEKAAVDAGIAAAKEKENFEKGLSGFTKSSVMEAEQGYKKALDAYANAYADAQSVGDDLGEGLKNGLENKRTSLYEKATSLVSGIISRMRKAADSHSPARKLIDFGEDMGEGTEIGLENKTKDLLATAKDQVDTLMGAYANAGDEMSQAAFTNVSRSSAQRESQAFTTLADHADKLDKILAAIERGHVLTIDGKQLVGQTAAMYDNELGRRRALAARGAL